MSDREIVSPAQFRESFENNLFDYLHENGVTIQNTSDAFNRYEDIQVAQGLNISLMSAIEGVADQYISQVLNLKDLATKCESNYEFKNSEDGLTLASKIKLDYQNLAFQVTCEMNVNHYQDDIEIHALINDVIKRIDEQIH